MMLSELNIDEDAFDIFVTFNAMEKIEFLSDAMEFGIDAAMLTQFGKITDNLKYNNSTVPISSQDFVSGNYRLCVTTMEGEVQLNSESRKTIQNFVTKLFADGLILTPIKKKKSDMDMYRYFKAYKVVGRCTPVSLS